MPNTLTSPGVYIEEIPSGVRTIMGVSTSTTAFVGKALKGFVNKPVLIHNFGEYTRLFGGLWNDSPMSFAVQQYFANGGSEAVIVRVTCGDALLLAQTTTFNLIAGAGTLVIQASSPGAWGNNLLITVDHNTRDPAKFFNLVITDPAPPTGSGTGNTETLRNLSIDPTSPSFVTRVLEQQSTFIRVQTLPAAVMPDPGQATLLAKGADGGDIREIDVAPASGPGGKKGMYALEDADIFNLLCLPPLTIDVDIPPSLYSSAATYCTKRRAMLVVDAPNTSTDPAIAINDLSTLLTSLPGSSDPANHAAIFFPRIQLANPLKNNLLQEFVPCGAVAGVFARIDAQRGVWKAPAGLEAGVASLQKLTYTLTDDENGDLNQLGINCIRNFPLIGPVVWGARTLQGADMLASEWKYIPVRRLALYIEESLFRGTQWVVFEPNDEPLWAQIRLNVGAFMHTLFRQGAFQGSSPRDAYFVKCDKETTTQDDINRGVVNILVGFAPLKPAEFVVIKIQQIAGQIQT